MEDFFCDFVCAFLHTKSLQRGVQTKRKEGAEGAQSFLLQLTPFRGEIKTFFDRVVSPETVSISIRKLPAP